MKVQLEIPPSLRVQRRGFTLVVTLTLMILLTLIAVGLLSLSTISLRTSSKSKDMAEARANARLALMIALNDLQKYAGPDQRITAAAAIGRGTQSPPRPFTKNLHWTGVWSTTALGDPTKPMVGANTDLATATGFTPPNANYLTDRRNLDGSLTAYKWNNNLRLAWLVSGNAPSPSASTTTNKVKLVSTGTLGTAPVDPTGDPVTVPMVDIFAGGNPTATGGYAYWVGDESLKARIDQGTPYEQGNAPKQPTLNNPTDGGFYNLVGTFGPDFTKMKAGTTTPYAPLTGMNSTERSKILTGGTVAVAANNTSDIKKSYYDITTDSMSVICDVREGGLKKDLTAYLETTGNVASDTTALPNNTANPGLAANQPILIGPNFKQLGPNFAHIRNWAKLRTNVTGNLGAGSIDPQYPPAVTMTATSMVPVDKISDISKQAQAIHPVMVDYSLSVDFSRDAAREGGRALRVHLYPRVTLWNPYNVTLKGARYLIASKGFHAFDFTKVWLSTAYNGPLFGGQEATWIPNDPSYWFGPGYNWSSWFYFVTDPVDMAPGECLVFVPDVTKSTGTKLASNSVKYNMSDVSYNILSATQVPGKGATNFFFASNKKVNDSVDIAAGINMTCGSAYDRPYGMQAYCFKKTGGLTGNIPITDVFNKPATQTLQLINDSVNGGDDKSYWAWPVLAGPKALETYESNDDRFPPPAFAQEVRTVSFADNWPQSTIAHYNLRASIAHRSPFCCGGSYYDQRPGSYRDCYFGSINLQDTNVIPPFIKGSDGKFKLRGSPFARAGIYGNVTSYPMFEVPQAGQPLFSLASLQSVQFGYQSWQPSFAIGHSLADIRSNRDASVNAAYFNDSKRWENMGGRWYEMLQMDLDATRQEEILQYDMAFMLNENLWDHYYLSGIPYNPSGSVAWDPTSGTPLPNSRLVLNPYASGTEANMKAKIGTAATNGPFDHSAYYLMNKGAFNINSASVEAWKAFFSTLNTIQRPCATGGGAPVLAVFSRMLVPPSDKMPKNTINDNGTWNGMKALTPTEIETLAQKMVDEVKNRGPFLGLTDFINRRLGPAATWTTDEQTVMGPLQAAIEKASQTPSTLNFNVTSPADGLSNPVICPRNGGGNFPTDNTGYYNWLHYGACGFLNQADFLQALGPNLTARGDTFAIRGYGEARDASGKVTARAWCEAMVQRTPDYIVSTSITQPSDATGNNPMEPPTIRSTTGNTWTENNTGPRGILPINKLFGRKMVITKFRWLNPQEI